MYSQLYGENLSSSGDEQRMELGADLPENSQRFINEYEINIHKKKIQEKLFLYLDNRESWIPLDSRLPPIHCTVDFIMQSNLSELNYCRLIPCKPDEIRFQLLETTWREVRELQMNNQLGVLLRNAIIRLKSNFKVRSKIYKIQSSFALCGDRSTINFILRSRDLRNEESFLVQFAKEGQDSYSIIRMRLAVLDSRTGDFIVVLKRDLAMMEEVPIENDTLKLRVEIRDQGADDIEIRAYFGSSMKEATRLQKREIMIPVLDDDVNVFVCGTTPNLDSFVYVSNFTVSQETRRDVVEESKCCTGSRCEIF